MVTVVGREYQSHVPRSVLALLGSQSRSQCECGVVYVLGLDEVEGVGAVL